MKPEGLMLGDWVNVKTIDKNTRKEVIRAGRVVELSPYYKHVGVAFREEDSARWFGIGFPPSIIEPIPLTVEILERNGFRYDDTDTAGLDYYCLGEPGNETACIVKKSGLDALKDTEEGQVVWCVYAGNCDVYDKVLYVHTLQHALRMSGINKEITSKIE